MTYLLYSIGSEDEQALDRKALSDYIYWNEVDHEEAAVLRSLDPGDSYSFCDMLPITTIERTE